MTAEKKTRLFIIATFLSFLVYGVFQSLYGAEASVMKDFFGTDSTQHGFVLTLQSLGGLAVAFLCAFMGDRVNKIRLCALGIALMAVGSLATGFAPDYAFLISMALIGGIGFTFIDIMNNAVIADVFAENKKTLIPALHMFFGIGSMAGPFFASASVDPQTPASFGIPFIVMGLAGACVVVTYIIAAKKIMPKTPYADKKQLHAADAGGIGDIFKFKTIYLLMAAGILYYSFQKGLQTWYTSFLEQGGLPFETAGIVLTLFFAGSLAMRIASPWLFNKFDIKKMCMLFVVLSAGVMAAALAAQQLWLIIALCVIAGALQGVFSASFVYFACDIFPTRSAGANSAVLIAISIGGTTAPLWMGAIADRAGFAIPMYMICAMLALSSLFVWLTYKSAAKENCA